MTLAPDPIQMPRPAWGIWATIGWSLLSFLASGATTLIVAMAWFGGEPSTLNLYSDLILILGLLVSTPVGILVLIAAARRRGWAAMDYFALNIPRRGEIVMAVIAVVVLVAWYALRPERHAVKQQANEAVQAPALPPVPPDNFVNIPAGHFQMGSPSTDRWRAETCAAIARLRMARGTIAGSSACISGCSNVRAAMFTKISP